MAKTDSKAGAKARSTKTTPSKTKAAKPGKAKAAKAGKAKAAKPGKAKAAKPGKAKAAKPSKAKGGRARARRRRKPDPARTMEIFRRLDELIDPRSDLEFSNTFELLLAVILSAQATDKQVNKITEPLFKTYKTPEDFVALGPERLMTEIQSIGLFRNKARNIVKACQTLIDEHGGEVPADRKALEALAGVGKKTAGVVMNVGFGAPTIPVDTHVFRLSNRLGLSDAKTPDKTEDQLLEVVPEPYLSSAHHLLILHGRYVCKARKPICEDCVLADLCDAEDKVDPGSLKTPRRSERGGSLTRRAALGLDG